MTVVRIKVSSKDKSYSDFLIDDKGLGLIEDEYEEYDHEGDADKCMEAEGYDYKTFVKELKQIGYYMAKNKKS